MSDIILKENKDLRKETKDLDIKDLIKGLTESQLEEIINGRISAERMKEIIEIAELENSMNG